MDREYQKIERQYKNPLLHPDPKGDWIPEILNSRWGRCSLRDDIGLYHDPKILDDYFNEQVERDKEYGVNSLSKLSKRFHSKE